MHVCRNASLAKRESFEIHKENIEVLESYIKYRTLVSQGSRSELIGYSDFDYAGCKVDIKSTPSTCLSCKITCVLVIQETKIDCTTNYQSRAHFYWKLLCTTLMDEGNFARLWNKIHTISIAL